MKVLTTRVYACGRDESCDNKSGESGERELEVHGGCGQGNSG